ncbi:hypothetical protein OS493_018818 [Desmophyllum pertusum]|uniref:VWFA domain-containing protein n=1 Tax=Desmophyllum pertusum TaxID=174260 RepID=A0A9W9ZDI0_9CNID|nr:hypothetical protein OS493_018818 [Desmophyllum pertusum]
MLTGSHLPAGVPNRTRLSTFWRPAPYPTNPNDPYYQAFQNVTSANVTAKRFMTNFLRIPHWTTSQGLAKRQGPEIEDNVVVMDGSGLVDAKYAAVTFSTSANVNFKFLPHSTAASEILKIPYPNGATNTQAGLAEAKKLFDDPSSGRRLNPTRRTVLLFTDGQSNIQPHLTIPNAQARRITT